MKKRRMAAWHRQRAACMANGTAFQYGWCATDDKDGRAIRTDFRKEDYISGPRTGAFVAKALAQLGLPFPPADKIFRGTAHDILFLDSHGVTIRIGPTIVEDLLHPGVLQPLGWVQDTDNDEITVAIYPSIEHYNSHYNSVMAETGARSLLDELYIFLDQTDQNTNDMNPRNIGIIRVDDHGTLRILPVIMDTDNEMNGTRSWDARVRKVDMMRHSLARGATPARAMQVALETVSAFSLMPIGDELLAAFGQHQPLREAFWDAWWEEGRPREAPDPVQMAAFWDKCAQATQAQPVPANGMGMPLRLYTPWTAAAIGPPLPHVQRDGLSYVWDRDVSAEDAQERGGNVMVAQGPSGGGARRRARIVNDAVLGPPRDSQQGLKGLYRYDKR